MGTIYCPPSQGSFIETITEYFSKISTNNTEIYILGDFNIKGALSGPRQFMATKHPIKNDQKGFF